MRTRYLRYTSRQKNVPAKKACAKEASAKGASAKKTKKKTMNKSTPKVTTMKTSKNDNKKTVSMKTSKIDEKTVSTHDSADDVGSPNVTSQPPKKHEENANVVNAAVVDSSPKRNNAVKVAVVDSSAKGNEGTAETENVIISGEDCFKINSVDPIRHFLLVKGVASNEAKIVDTGEN